MKNLARLKGKSIKSNVQPSQDNREDMVKKLEKESTVTCSKCHLRGHKSHKCFQPKKKFSNEKNKKNSQSRVLSSTPSPTEGTKVITPPM